MVHTVELAAMEDGDYWITAVDREFGDLNNGPLKRDAVLPYLLLLGLPEASANTLMEQCDKYKNSVFTRITEEQSPEPPFVH
jgi:hypothetical protein